jgi:hypothetical protein
MVREPIPMREHAKARERPSQAKKPLHPKVSD